MDKSKNRNDAIRSQLIHMRIPFTRIKAIDGSGLSIEEKKKTCSVAASTFCTDGIIGCHLSHQKAWKTFLKDGAEYALILEDDCILQKNFKNKLNLLLKEINRKNKNWDFLYLGFLTLGYLKIFKSLKGSIHPSAKRYHIPLQPLGFHCYMITRACALKMVSILRTVEYHVDLQFLYNSDSFNVFASKTQLGIQNSTSDNSTLSVSKFPRFINLAIDKAGIKQDNISLSYHLSAPILQIPIIKIPVNTHILFLLFVWQMSSFTRYPIRFYMLFELLTYDFNKDIIFWGLFAHFFLT